MKSLRTGLAAAAATATMIVPALMVVPATAHAAPAPVVVSPDDLNGWNVTGFPTPTSVPFAFVEGPATIGTGSLQFGPIAAEPATNKMIVNREQVIPAADFGGIAYDFYIDPDAANTDPKQFYLNVYVQTSASGSRFFDCRYDFVPTAGTTDWNTLDISPGTVARVEAANGATCGDSIDDVATDGSIFRITLNGGDTNPNDAGIEGGFDNVRIAADGVTVTYDFEPARVTACDSAPIPGRTGTPANDVVRGTAGADRLDLLAGNDLADTLGGADCVLGGAGRDVLRAGDGDDEVLGGADADVIDAGTGADVVDPGAGRDVVSAGAGDDELTLADGETDVVDCGAGTDEVRADVADVLRNCETVTRV